MMFKKGDAVVIWRKNGEGIYDGNINYVRKVMSTRQGVRYGLSDANEGSPRGYMEPDVLIAADDFQKMIDSGEVQRLWEGDIEKLTRVLARRTAQSQPATAPTAGGEWDYQSKWFSVSKQLAELRVDYDELFRELEEAPPQSAVDDLQADLAALRSQVAALTSERDAMRAALAEIYDDADYMLEDQYDDDERTHRYFKGIRDAAYVVLKKGSQS